jgi:hypothetical protein
MIEVSRYRVTFITPIGRFQDILHGPLNHVETLVSEMVRGARTFHRISYTDEVIYLSGEVLKNSVIQIATIL